VFAGSRGEPYLAGVAADGRRNIDGFNFRIGQEIDISRVGTLHTKLRRDLVSMRRVHYGYQSTVLRLEQSWDGLPTRDTTRADHSKVDFALIHGSKSLQCSPLRARSCERIGMMAQSRSVRYPTFFKNGPFLKSTNCQEIEFAFTRGPHLGKLSPQPTMKCR